eukprot:TRINITY_DN79525_c0_g1_i1.p1 TRINITY_DN79525_c0_g1~~TRINITY_DN79525_c0_g1_i1.p1  ORF type:complete len:495 (+),score=91.86 TRINITY_DN79525_c0_g1_i1:34-1485(+)
MKQLPRRALGAYFCAEGAGYLHHCYAERRARRAPPPTRVPADAEYGRQFLQMARCDAREGGADAWACARFLRHAFYGTPPEALSREVVTSWLRDHLGDVEAEDVAALETALGPYAPKGGSRQGKEGEVRPPAFVYGEGEVDSWYKPLLLRGFLEAQRHMARRRLAAEGFTEFRDPEIAWLRYWHRKQDGEEPTLVVLHGYGRGLASPLFEQMLPNLNRGSMIIVDCPWLLVTRVPGDGDLTEVPTVRQIASAVAGFLAERFDDTESEVDLLAHSFGTAVASALARELEAHKGQSRKRVHLRRAVLMDPMCFIAGISKQAQLLRRTPRDLATELVEEAAPGSPGPSAGEVIRSIVNKPKPCMCDELDEETAAKERRKWVIYQTYFFNYFIFRDLVYCWVNLRALQGPEYLDRGLLRDLNKRGRLLTVLAETDTMIPAPQLRDELSSDVPSGSSGGIMWLPTVGHGACQHREDVVDRIRRFLSAA